MKNLKTTQELNELKSSYVNCINNKIKEIFEVIEDWELELNDDVKHSQYKILDTYTKNMKDLINMITIKTNEIDNIELEEIEDEE